LAISSKNLLESKEDIMIDLMNVKLNYLEKLRKKEGKVKLITKIKKIV
jgi:hypothetical protein